MNVTYYIMEAAYGVEIKVVGPMGQAEITLTKEQYERFKPWADGHDQRMIQDVFPDLSADQREILMTGIGPEQWDRMFKTEED